MTHLAEILIELYKRGEYEPICEQGGDVHTKQVQALTVLNDSTTKEFAYGGGAGGAKSWTGCQWVLFNSLIYPGTRYFIGREELKRLRESTLLTFFKVSRAYGFEREVDWRYNAQDHFIQFINGSRIDLLDLKYLPSDPMFERYGSVEYTSGWIEEAGEIHLQAYDVLKTRINRYENRQYNILGKIFVTLNPKKNWCKQYYYDMFKKNLLPVTRKFLPSLVTDNPFIDKEYIYNLQAISNQATKQRLLYGNFDYDDDDNTLIEFDKINDIFTNSHVIGNGYMCMSCDIALSNDFFVLIVWDGLTIKKIYRTTKISSSELITIIQQYATEWAVPMSNIVYDADGIGAYIEGYLPGAIGINNNHKASRPDYNNLKSELYFMLADSINKAEVKVENINDTTKEILINELQAVKMDIDSVKLQVIKKSKVKELIGHSPDLTDAMAYRFLIKLIKNK